MKKTTGGDNYGNKGDRNNGPRDAAERGEPRGRDASSRPPSHAPSHAPSSPPWKNNSRRDDRSGLRGTERESGGVEQPRHGRVMLYGFHAVTEALKSPRRKAHRLYATENAVRRIEESNIALDGVEVVPVRPDSLDRVLGTDAVHQGLALEAEPLPGLDLEDIPAEGIILVLDQVTDPHNVGAILRTAAAFDVRALVITERHSPQTTGVLAKTASGGLEHVPIITVVNLSQALTTLGNMGFWRIGLDSDGPATLASVATAPPVALVLGAEGKGLRRLTRERCDALARLDMPGAIKSLNVSNAAAVALATLVRI